VTQKTVASEELNAQANTFTALVKELIRFVEGESDAAISFRP
jgi:hypothetical protein